MFWGRNHPAHQMKFSANHWMANQEEHTHTHAHTSCTQSYRPSSLSLPTPPQISQFTELCHRTSPASPLLPAPCALFPRRFCSTVPRPVAGSESASRKLATTDGFCCDFAANVWSCSDWPAVRGGAQSPFFLASCTRSDTRGLAATCHIHPGLQQDCDPNSRRVGNKESGEKICSTEVTALYFSWCVCVFLVHPPLSTLSPYLEPDWLLQMARLRRSLLYPILPPLSVSKCEFTHVVRGSIVASPPAELPRLIGGSGCLSSRLRCKSRKKGSRQQTAMRCFKFFQSFISRP